MGGMGHKKCVMSSDKWSKLGQLRQKLFFFIAVSIIHDHIDVYFIFLQKDFYIAHKSFSAERFWYFS